MSNAPRVLSQDFYRRDVRAVARRLLGKRLVSEIDGRRTSGIIVETESYLAQGDSACHGSKKQTRKNEVMFGPAGFAYVYPIHARYCFNVVTESIGKPSAVLIRAVEPLEGIETMQQRRSIDRRTDLARGPARLCEALAVGPTLNGHDLTAGRFLWIEDATGDSLCDCEVITTRRIGVTSAKELLLRFAFHPHPFVSGPKNWR